MRVFIASAIIALILLVDEIEACRKRHNEDEEIDEEKEETKRRKFNCKLVHTIETLLHTASDHQLVAGIALLLSLNRQACEISVYHNNLVCVMLVMLTRWLVSPICYIKGCSWSRGMLQDHRHPRPNSLIKNRLLIGSFLEFPS
jgi:hypothetical protein